MSKKLVCSRLAIKMNSSVDPDKHYISPGGYELSSKNESVMFDFQTYIGNVNKGDDTVINFELVDLDTDVFPESEEKITEDFLKSVDKIEEFYMYLEDKGDVEIHPKNLLYWEFEFDDGNIISLNNEIINKFIFK